MIRAAADAIMAALDPIPVVVHDSKVPASPDLSAGYVALFSGQPGEESDRASGFASTANHEFTTTAVGTNAAQVRLIMEWVRDALIDVRPVIPGRLTTPIEWLSSSGPPREDNDVPAKPLYAAVQWRFTSVPVPS